LKSEGQLEYHLGYSDAEYERLIRQATRLAPVTEHFFQEAGIGPGQRVLDIGSGAGDVAMLLGRLVGPSGEVVGVEREARSIERAQMRVAQEGIRNVRFVQADIAQFKSDGPFNAAVGRYVLQFIQDPVLVLRSLSSIVSPGGIIAFQEGSFAPYLTLSAHLPLRSACVSLQREAAARSGVNVEMGPALHKVFQDAGLPVPKMRLVMEMGYEPEYTRWLSDSIASTLPRIEQLGLSVEALGDLQTLQERLHEEVAHSNTVVPWIALVGAWCRIPK